jgi:hypothetical protein
LETIKFIYWVLITAVASGVVIGFLATFLWFVAAMAVNFYRIYFKKNKATVRFYQPQDFENEKALR